MLLGRVTSCFRRRAPRTRGPTTRISERTWVGPFCFDLRRDRGGGARAPGTKRTAGGPWGLPAVPSGFDLVRLALLLSTSLPAGTRVARKNGVRRHATRNRLDVGTNDRTTPNAEKALARAEGRGRGGRRGHGTHEVAFGSSRRLLAAGLAVSGSSRWFFSALVLLGRRRRRTPRGEVRAANFQPYGSDDRLSIGET